ncbi:MAG TPA: hypothetical protein VMJ10_20310 [Kofleriaceae bacterium]|nr:hypothetical protein [Kofleriaceae bacterium]
MRSWALLGLLAACRLHFSSEPSGAGPDGSVVGADSVASTQLAVQIAGYGAVTTTNGDACADQCMFDDVSGSVTLTAIAGEGWQLDHYSAPCGTDVTCTVPAGTQVTATFTVAPITANLVFVTSTAATVSGGLAALDTLCANQAAAAGKTGTFIAYASTSTQDAKTRLNGKRGWVRSDGLPFLDVPSTIGTALPRGVPYDATGSPQLEAAVTGTTVSGTYASGLNCSDWTVQSNGEQVAGTLTWNAGIDALGNDSTACAGNDPILCFQIDHTMAVTLHPAPFPVGRYIFTSTNPFPMTGLAAADAQCQNEATAGNLPGSYVALLATTTQSASDRVGGLAGLWRRADGIVVSRTGLDTSLLDAAVDVDATGAVVDNAVWLGASSATALGDATTTCMDYSTTTNTTTQYVIYSYNAELLSFVGGGSSECSAGVHLLCAQLP